MSSKLIKALFFPDWLLWYASGTLILVRRNDLPVVPRHLPPLTVTCFRQFQPGRDEGNRLHHRPLSLHVLWSVTFTILSPCTINTRLSICYLVLLMLWYELLRLLLCLLLPSHWCCWGDSTSHYCRVNGLLYTFIRLTHRHSSAVHRRELLRMPFIDLIMLGHRIVLRCVMASQHLSAEGHGARRRWHTTIPSHFVGRRVIRARPSGRGSWWIRIWGKLPTHVWWKRRSPNRVRVARFRHCVAICIRGHPSWWRRISYSIWWSRWYGVRRSFFRLAVSIDNDRKKKTSYEA